MNADDYLSDPQNEDLALDFVENELGRIHFRSNWERLENKENKVRSWLTSISENPDRAPSLVQHLSDLYEGDVNWGRTHLAPEPIAPERQSKSSRGQK